MNRSEIIPNITPNETRLNEFRLWCQKVMPLVYDESLSYYELLSKVVSHLNDTEQQVIANGENIEELYRILETGGGDLPPAILEQIENNTKGLDTKVDKFQGEGLSGKFLGIDSFGNVAPVGFPQKILEKIYANTSNIETKVAIAQGVENSGKVLGVNDKGNVVPVDTSTGALTPKNFGAKGDGVTDDTAKVQEYANWCETNNEPFVTNYGEIYKVTNVNINSVHSIRSEGEIKGNLTIKDFSSRIGHSTHVFINKVEGTIELQGFNSALVEIVTATKLRLVGEGTQLSDPNHFIGYSTFMLGFIHHLEIDCIGQEGWVNENLFFGGRFETVTMDSHSKWAPENNTFYKCMAESAVFNIIKGRGNNWFDARLEGTAKGNIKFSDDAYGNVITSNFSPNKAGYYTFGEGFHNDVSTDYVGCNKLEINPDLNVYPLIEISENNNPYNIPLNGHKLQCKAYQLLFESKKVAVPTDPFCIMCKLSDLAMIFGIKCYDATMTPISEKPLFVSESPVVGWASWENSFGNLSNNRDNYWTIIVPKLDPKVKYISLWGKNGKDPKDIDGITFTLTSYSRLPQDFVYCLSTPQPQA